MPEDLWVLGTKLCEDMTRFCTSPVSSYPFSVDPTFNFGKYEVTRQASSLEITANWCPAGFSWSNCTSSQQGKKDVP